MAAHADSAAAGADTAEAAGLDTGNYEVLRKRLIDLGRELAKKAEALNEERQAVFGGTALTVIGNERVRTDNNCLPRDIVNAGGYLFFGYNVFLGLKSKTEIKDVFSLHRFAHTEDGFDLSEVGQDALPGFLDDGAFGEHFSELYQYYKNSKLLQLSRPEGKLLAIFQIGSTLADTRVFRWAVDARGRPTYIDNRGERDHLFPESHDFEWTPTTREMHVGGRHPHVSIEDECFVETVGGDLTVKVEDNTESGEGIYAELVDDPNQSLADGQIWYARLGTLILLKILPYREDTWRYLVFNTRAKSAMRIDAIGQACVQLPEDHGIIFPGGYYLQTGEHKLFEADIRHLEFFKSIRSPNGEDVLYVFHHRRDGRYVLFPYNLIRKEIANPIHCHGYSLFDDGKMVVFKAVGEEPTRVHPMQVWQTPFMSDEHAARAPVDDSFLAKVGNADLVRGISDCLTIRRRIENQEPTRQRYEDLIAAVTRALDAYYWLDREEVGDMRAELAGILKNAELIIDEFEKVLTLKERAREALAEAEETQTDLVRTLRPEGWKAVDQYMEALTKLRTRRGHVISLREVRYIDLGRVEELEEQAVAEFDRISRAAVEFLLKAEALAPLLTQLQQLYVRIEGVEKTPHVTPLAAELDRINDGLDVLSEVVGGLEIEDPTARTQILEDISEVFGQLNRVRATLMARRKELLSAEGRAEFGAQFKLFGQSVSSALSLADTPEKCDEQLSRLMVQLEELEGRFSEFDEFLGQLAEKREEVYEAFLAKKQTLLDAIQRRVQNIASAAERIITGVKRRARSFKDVDELNAYFASDAMVLKLQQLGEQLLGLGDSVKADEVAARLKAAKQEAHRGLRDRLDLFDEGAAVIKLGRHRFNVNTQPLELTMVPRDGEMVVHLTGTDFYERVGDDDFLATKPFWSQSLVSETADVYRAEYLAACMLAEAEERRGGLTLPALREAALEPEGLLKVVRKYAAERYDEGYERGLHDADAALILGGLLQLTAVAGLLQYSPAVRSLAALFWATLDDAKARARWHRRARSLGRLVASFAHSDAIQELAGELGQAIAARLAPLELELDASEFELAGHYLAKELQVEQPRFTSSGEAIRLRDGLLGYLDGKRLRDDLEGDLSALEGQLEEQFDIARAWLEAYLASGLVADSAALRPALFEAVCLLLSGDRLDWEPSSARTSLVVEGLLGQHRRVVDRKMELRLDEFLSRLTHFRKVTVPGYRQYRKVLGRVLERKRVELRVDEYLPRVLTSFVRNRLINEVYLPLIGDNLAKQLGALGEGKRTDLMGLLLLISPPGYGKTTLMEYIANRLGLVFMKVNGPSLGHQVMSLDPEEAPNATARQEVDKINLALEMSNNVMLYLDDIQHTNAELLQKFISLCDAQRRIEGIWQGRTRTYDLRGKKFCVVMAGNPYTESGEKFQIPDMLANRADTYNLGDILEGKDDVFALSYIENALTSNPTLAPLAGRDQKDIYLLIRMAGGEQIPTTDLSYQYSAVELNELMAVFKHLFRVQQVLLAVNQQYIASASMDDAYRTEPRFQLQGSYRNMNKIAEKVVGAMNDEELEHLLDDHYQGESQTLTTGAEQNVLKLAELRGVMTPEQKARWEEVKAGFQRVQRMGSAADDPVTRVTGTLSLLGDQLGGIRTSLLEAADLARQAQANQPPPEPSVAGPVLALAKQLDQAIATLSRPQLEVKVSAEPPEALEAVLERQAVLVQQTLLPLARAAAHNLQQGRVLNDRLAELLMRLVGSRRAAAPPEADTEDDASNVYVDPSLFDTDAEAPRGRRDPLKTPVMGRPGEKKGKK